MNFTDYQRESRSVAIYPDIGMNIQYPALGLAGEAGEVCDKIKKIMRDDAGLISEEVRQAVSKELGDTLWYLAAVASEFRLDLNKIAEENLDKLRRRRAAGTLSGSGDER